MTNSLIYGVIPARKNSKGLPGKNFKLLNGKPLVHYTCEAALGSQLDAVFLNTDDEKIIDYVQKNFPQIKIPFKRPDHLAEDKSLAIDVAHYFLDWIPNHGITSPAALCWLQPTSPLRTPENINEAIQVFKSTSPSSVISMVKVNAMNPYKMKTLQGGFLTDAFSHGGKSSNRQDLPEFYICNGAIFLASVETLRKGTFYGDQSRPLAMPEEASVNIDSEVDFLLAELLLQRKK